MRRLPFVVVCCAALAVSSCAGTPESGGAQQAPDPSAFGGVRLSVNQADLSAASIARIDYAIGPGAGAFFSSMLGQLSAGATSDWTAFITGIPAGPGRIFDLTAYDAGGVALYRGGAVIDIAAQATASVTALLFEVSPAPGQAATAPTITFLTLSSAVVQPGGTALLRVGATPGSGAAALSYAWSASCGSFSDSTAPDVVWTAPGQSGVRCLLSLTAASADASSTERVSVAVRSDTAARDVSGQRLVACWGDPPVGNSSATPGSLPAPDTVAGAAPEGLVVTGPGVFVPFPGGHFAADGSFAAGGFDVYGDYFIPQLPAAEPYVLSFLDGSGVRWLVDTPSSTVDLGYDLPGRCDVTPASASTQVSFNLTGLYPWDPAWGQLQLSSSSADVWTQLSTAGIPAGSPAASTQPMSWSAPFPLFASSDTVWLHQMIQGIHPDGLHYRSAARAAALQGPVLQDGGFTELSAELKWIPSASLPVSWSPPDFETHLGDLAPAARVLAGAIPPHRLSIGATPHQLTAPAALLAGGSPEMASVELPAGAAAFTLSSPLRYGQFLPAFWLEWREVRFATAVAYLAPGATAPLSDVASVGRRDPLPATGEMLVPTVTPVQQLTIAGAAALADLIAPVTTSPTFAWAPPALGSPAYYQIEIVKLSSAASATTGTTVLRYLTAARQVTIPPGILLAGGLYYARVTALVSSVPFETAPLRHAAVYAWATTLTGTFSP